jgi:hypothetical protein
MEVTGRQGKRRKQLLDDLKKKKVTLEIEPGSTSSHSVENSLCKRQDRLQEDEMAQILQPIFL